MTPSRSSTIRLYLPRGLALLTLTLLPGLSTAALAEEVTAPGASLEKVWTGGEFTEGPAQGPLGEIYFSDIPNRRILRHEPGGDTRVFREDSGRANGLIFDRRGRLLACEGAAEGGRRRVVRYEHDGTVTVLAESFEGKRLNSPNDITLDDRGRIYFSDPRYGSQEGRELDLQSVYRIDAPGQVTRIITEVRKPNGLAISPDGKTLYVSDTEARELHAWTLTPEGEARDRRAIFDFGEQRGIDGMEVDTEGNIWAAAGSGDTAAIHVISPAGKLLGKIPVPEFITNCCFAGPRLDTLYITSGTSLYRIRIRARGFVRFPAAGER